MKKLLPILLFIGITLVFFKQFFLNGFLPIPSDALVGLYNPLRDFYAKEYPHGIPFKNFLITDPVRQQYPWRELSISLEKKLELPLWNPYDFSGEPLLANFQSAAFYPLNILLFIFPFQIGWSLLIILQPLLAGIFLYLYLRKMKVSLYGSLLSAITFSFCGFSIAWMEWNIIVQTALWLPLIFLVKEILIEKFTYKWAVVLILIESTMIFAGHLQTFFYIFIISDTYLMGRIGQEILRKSKHDHFLSRYINKFAQFLLLACIIALITSIQWLPTLQFIQLSARDIDQSQWQQAGWFIPWQHLIQFVVPDFFGNPTTLNYWGVWNYAELVGYVGIVSFILAMVAIFYRRDTKTLFFGAFFFLSLLFALPTIFAQLPFILHVPLISTSQPTRLLFITDFCLAILAGLGLDTWLQNKKTVLLPVAIISIFFIGLWGFVITKNHFGFSINPNDLLTTKRNLIFSSLLFAGTVCLFLLLLIISFMKKWKKWDIIFATILIAITIFDLFRFGWKFLPFAPAQYLYPSTKTITFLQNNIGNYRYMTTNSQILPPNVSIMYKLQSVDGYDPLYLLAYGEFIAASERGNPNIQPPFGYNRIITPHRYDSPLMNILGVKYVLSLNDIHSSSLTKVFQEGETRVYENKKVLPRAFFAKNIISTNSKQQTIDTMFNSVFNPKNTAVVQDYSGSTMFSAGMANIVSYAENIVIIHTENSGGGFLVFTDIYYPTWRAYIDGKEAKLIRTDYTLRGIVVPSGSHTVRFEDHLL